MSRLRVRPHAPDLNGRVLSVTPESAGWNHVGFAVHTVEPGQTVSGSELARETCLVVLKGVADVGVGNEVFPQVGGRQSVFDDTAPGAVYVPAGAAWSVTASDAVELAVCSAPGKGGLAARRIDPTRMTGEVRGKGTNLRRVRNILPETEPAEGLLVVEVITPGGHWSSYPPHKHDTASQGEETQLEETYYHRLNPPQGFAVQRVYTDDRSIDETVSVEDGDVVMVPRGYHPVGAPHGYDLYYLNVMAGPERRWVFRNDPQHAWIVKKG
jgi:5-deoxy-glucuronate isomerase